MNNSELQQLLSIDRSSLPEDGGAEYNRLIFSHSPYLLQHAKNPVEWREWGEDAFTEAKIRNMPLLVSIGYSTCHWCHVMAHESFESPEVAELLNRLFITIKVDREERPDLDDFYMTAARTLSGGGGWPLNVFIDHNKRPFFAITYLPIYPKYKTPGFIDLLNNISALWTNNRELISSNAESLHQALVSSTIVPPSVNIPLENCRKNAITYLEDIHDQTYGGFGMATKFPMPTYLLFLLSSSGNAREMALKTLDMIIDGGIHDQIGGGFHRYAVDRQWITPHFEKMLYDQALLISSLCMAYKTTGRTKYLDVAEKTASFCVRELLSPDGGFCAGVDADSEGGEGVYYTWGDEELANVLSGNLSPLASYWKRGDNYRLDGNMILCPSTSLTKFADKINKTVEEWVSIYLQGCNKLLAVRSNREAPLRDLKIVCSWNGLLISSFVHLYEASANQLWMRHASENAKFIIDKMFTPYSNLKRTMLGGKTGVDGFVEDYAMFADALATICRHDSDNVYKFNLKKVLEQMMAEFINESGEVSFTARSGEQLPIALSQVQDNVTPSSAAATAMALLNGGRLLKDREMTKLGRTIIERYRGYMEKSPASCLSLIMAAELAE